MIKGRKICRNQNVAEHAVGTSSAKANGFAQMKKQTDMESKRSMMRFAIHMRVVNLHKKEAEKSASFLLSIHTPCGSDSRQAMKNYASFNTHSLVGVIRISSGQNQLFRFNTHSRMGVILGLQVPNQFLNFNTHSLAGVILLLLFERIEESISIRTPLRE